MSIPTVGVLVFQNDTVLLVKHGEKASHVLGSYGLPAGRVEEDESTIHAAVRELKEETGLEATEEDLELLPLNIPDADIKRSDGTTKTFSITVFLCRKYSGELQHNFETIPEWVAIKDVHTLPLIVNTGLFIEKGLKYR